MRTISLFGKKKRLTRVEKLKRQMTDQGMSEQDADELVSLYIPQRRARRFGRALLRLDKLRLFLLAACLIIAIIFIAAFFQEKSGNFTINLDRLELYRKGISIAADGDFTQPTARLSASAVEDATNITVTDLPENLDEVDGDHSGQNYMAYTYYVRNAGKEDVSYIATLDIESSSKGVEQAARVAVWHNGVRTIYAAPARDGSPEPGCVSFRTSTMVFSDVQENFLVGNVDKYTVCIWLEGEDPECVDAIVGGSIEFAMNIKATESDDKTLFEMWIQDLIDTIRGDRPISPGGVDAPDYSYSNVTWETRRNQ